MRGKPRTLDKTILDEGRRKKEELSRGDGARRDFEIFEAPALSQRLSIISDRRW